MTFPLKRPRLKGSIQLLRARDGAVWCLSELSYRRVRIDDTSGLAWALLSRADGTLDSRDLADAAAKAAGISPSQAEDAMRALADAGLWEDAARSAPPDVPLPYWRAFKRNVYFFSDLETPERDRYEIAASLYRSRVALLGLGGTGSWVAATLLAGGVGRLRGIDLDIVEDDNLGRQIMYRTEDLGKPKAVAMADQVRRFNPHIAFEGRHGAIRSAADVRELVDGCDFLVVGCVGPRFSLYRWVNEACLEAGVPFLIVETRRVGPLVSPGRSACNACYEKLLRGSHPFYDDAVAALDDAPATTERMPQFGPLVAYTATRAGLEVVRHLSGVSRPETLDAVLQIDAFDLQWTRHEVPRDPECRACRK